MRKLAILAALAAFAGGAHAADLYKAGGYKDEPIGYAWTGFYAGINGGGASADASWKWYDFAGTTSNASANGGIVGGQIGYNWQFSPTLLIGVEGSIDWVGINGSANENPYLDTAIDRTKFDGWLADVSGRLGYIVSDRTLVYGKAGVAFADITRSAFYGAGSLFNVSWDQTNVGWLLGAGLEVMLFPHWSAKIEYNHLDFGFDNFTYLPNVPFVSPATVHYHETADLVKVGVNYQFNGPIYTPLK